MWFILILTMFVMALSDVKIKFIKTKEKLLDTMEITGIHGGPLSIPAKEMNPAKAEKMPFVFKDSMSTVDWGPYLFHDRGRIAFRNKFPKKIEVGDVEHTKGKWITTKILEGMITREEIFVGKKRLRPAAEPFKVTFGKDKITLNGVIKDGLKTDEVIIKKNDEVMFLHDRAKNVKNIMDSKTRGYDNPFVKFESSTEKKAKFGIFPPKTVNEFKQWLQGNQAIILKNGKEGIKIHSAHGNTYGDTYDDYDRENSYLYSNPSSYHQDIGYDVEYLLIFAIIFIGVLCCCLMAGIVVPIVAGLYYVFITTKNQTDLGCLTNVTIES